MKIDAPKEGEELTRTTVVVPLVSQLLTVYASNVNLSNLIIEHSAGVPDCGQGSAPRGACDADLAEMATGAVFFGGGATNCSVNRVTVRDAGGYAIKANNAPGLAVNRCLLRGCGAGGTLINDSPCISHADP